MSQANIRVAELDFDQIKENFKQFIKSKSEFTDYDYEGSGLSVIMDLLAYNTHYNAITANMLLQEMYLDTAVKRESVALIAKRLGYTPKSFVAPKAIVNLEVIAPDFPFTLTLNKNQTFTANLNYRDSLKFINLETLTIQKNSEDRYIFENVEIYEGTLSKFRYVVDTQINQKFEIPSKYVDVSKVKVSVQKSLQNSETTNWTNFTSIIDVKASTKAYFVKLNENLNYEIYFGDGVIGEKLIDGNVVIIEYLITNGDLANKTIDITFSDSVDGYTNTKTTVLTPAFGGALAESIQKTKTSAQNSVLNQNRCVTSGDYAAVINEISPMEQIIVYGGETLPNPVYGKVFISAKQFDTTNPLNDVQKNNILSILKKKSVMGIVPVMIDPDYMTILLDTEIRYLSDQTKDDKNTIYTLALQSIKDYNTKNLNKFETDFNLFSLMDYINNIHKSFVSNDTKIKLKKEFVVYDGVTYNYKIQFNSFLKQSNSKEMNILSEAFYIDDTTKKYYIGDQDGSLFVFYYTNGKQIVYQDNIGTVDYNKGLIEFDFNLPKQIYDKLSFTVVPEKNNFITSGNNILNISENDINIRLVN